MRLLLDIRFGTERYPEKVARRLRTVNIGTRIAAAFHAFLAALSLAYFTRFWWLAIAHTVAMLLFAGVPLLHRLGLGQDRLPPSSCSIWRQSPTFA